MHTAVVDLPKPEAFEEPQGAVEVLDIDPDGLAHVGGFSLKIVEYGSADPSVVMFRQERCTYLASGCPAC